MQVSRCQRRHQGLTAKSDRSDWRTRECYRPVRAECGPRRRLADCGGHKVVAWTYKALSGTGPGRCSGCVMRYRSTSRRYRGFRRRACTWHAWAIGQASAPGGVGPGPDRCGAQAPRRAVERWTHAIPTQVSPKIPLTATEECQGDHQQTGRVCRLRMRRVCLHRRSSGSASIRSPWKRSRSAGMATSASTRASCAPRQ